MWNERDTFSIVFINRLTVRSILLHLRENVRVYSASAVVSRATLTGGGMGLTVQQTPLKVKMAVL
jgi:hypothetical protein